MGEHFARIRARIWSCEDREGGEGKRQSHWKIPISASLPRGLRETQKEFPPASRRYPEIFFGKDSNRARHSGRGGRFARSIADNSGSPSAPTARNLHQRPKSDWGWPR